jgi:ribose transport system substrate-binding protein
MKNYAAGRAMPIVALAGLVAAVAVSPTSAKQGRVSVSGVEQAKAKVLAAMKLPTFKPPGAAVPMSKLKGKNVWIMTSTLTVPFVADIAHGAQTAAKTAGWNTRLIDGKGNITEWNRILGEAISQKVDAVISVASSPVVMKPQMAKAKAAGIPVVDVLTADQADPLVPGTFAHVSISFYTSGTLQADYVIWKSGGKADVLIFGDNEFPGEVTRVKGMKDEFHKLCPACKVTFQDTQVGKLGTGLGQTAQTLLRRDPSINWVLPTYDAQALYIVPAIKQAGLAGKVKVVSSDAVKSNLDWTAKSDVQIADVGEPDQWAGWASVDMIARAMLHMPRVQPGIPLRMFDATNLKNVNTGDADQLFGGSYVAQYKRLWGLG